MDPGVDVFRQRYERYSEKPTGHHCVRHLSDDPREAGALEAISNALGRGENPVEASKKYREEYEADLQAYNAQNEALKREG